MVVTTRWHRPPRPDPEVVHMLERALIAAKSGRARAVVVVLVNPLHQVEAGAAGPTDDVMRNVMLGGLVRAARKVLENIDPW